jgi:hypothetical protein
MISFVYGPKVDLTNEQIYEHSDLLDANPIQQVPEITTSVSRIALIVASSRA